MDAKKVKMFIDLAGQKAAAKLQSGSPEERKLGAQLLLSETLEYIIKGLGVIPNIHGNAVTDPEAVSYEAVSDPSSLEMVDGLSDVAYTMYWNSLCFGIPLDDAFNLVCDNNLEKFIKLDKKNFKEGSIPEERWHCDKGVSWPAEVKTVDVVLVNDDLYAVGKDARGKVRKPSTYRSVNLKPLVEMSS